jgi:hypothetical protein
MKSLSENTPIEKTKCGSCVHFEKDCPRGNNRNVGLVYPFFAEKCRAYEKKKNEVKLTA